MKYRKYLLGIIIIVVVFLIILISTEIIKENKNNIEKIKEEGINLNKTLNITKGGTYKLKGTIEDGHIYIKSNEAVRIIFEGVNITNSNGPAIIIEDAPATTIILADDTVNNLTDGNVYKNIEFDGCINAQDDLLIKGNGTLNINSISKRGIAAKDKLIIDGGNYKIKSKEEGIKVNEQFDILDGNIEIDSELEGIKVSNKKDKKIGTLKVDNVELKINTLEKGISCRNKIILNNGNIDINAKRTGLKSKNIEINGGKLNIVAFENGIVASGTKIYDSIENKYYHENDAFLTINNGLIQISSEKDGVKINGIGNMNNGYLEIYTNYGLKSSCLDQDVAFNMNGGTLLAFGYNNKLKKPDQDSKQQTYIYKFDQTNDKGHLEMFNQDKLILNLEIKNKYQYIMVSTPNIKDKQDIVVKVDGKIVEIANK